jgi:cytochrome c oxidase subunit 3
MRAVTSEYSQSKIHSHKFALWIGIATIIMMFGAFTSAYIVRRACRQLV